MALSKGEHIRCPPGTLINNRWKVVQEVGCGNFAKVYKCTDVNNLDAVPVAVKVLKKEYAQDAAFENDILKALNAKTQGGDARGHKVVRKLDSFTWHRAPCFVFAIKGANLRGCKMGIARGHTNPGEIREFVKQMLATLAFLHDDVRMCHTDLKPENILLDSPGPAPTNSIGTGWTIADFGSASFYNPAKPDKDLISTRPYRAPEVVLGLAWSTKADIWSMACIFFELYHGGRLFDVADDGVHLAAFERRISKLPLSMARNSKYFRKFYDEKGGLLRPTGSTGPQRHMREIVVNDPHFLDLLMGMLQVDPERRMTARQALQHPYLTGSHVASSERHASASAAHASDRHGSDRHAGEAGGAHPQLRRVGEPHVMEAVTRSSATASQQVYEKRKVPSPSQLAGAVGAVSAEFAAMMVEKENGEAAAAAAKTSAQKPSSVASAGHHLHHREPTASAGHHHSHHHIPSAHGTLQQQDATGREVMHALPSRRTSAGAGGAASMMAPSDRSASSANPSSVSGSAGGGGGVHRASSFSYQAPGSGLGNASRPATTSLGGGMPTAHADNGGIGQGHHSKFGAGVLNHPGRANLPIGGGSSAATGERSASATAGAKPPAFTPRYQVQQRLF